MNLLECTNNKAVGQSQNSLKLSPLQLGHFFLKKEKMIEKRKKGIREEGRK
jgi:hypothetical protein